MDTYNSQEIFIGIDGGASKTRGVIFDIEGNTLLMLHSKGSNLAVYKEQGSDRICNLIEDLIDQSHIDRESIKCIGLGIAGSSNQDGRDILFKGLDKTNLSKKTLLTNDAEAAYQVCCPNDEGLLVTVGTGVICIGKNSEGKLFRTAGKGHYSGDIGSGFWIGVQTILKLSTNDEICAYNPIDTREIQEVIYQKLEINNFNQDLEQIMQSSEVVSIIASLSKSIIELAGNKNAVALSIVQQSTIAVADYIIDLANQLNFKSENIILSVNGSIIRNRFFRNSLEDALQFNFNQIKWISSKIPTAYGAAILAAKYKGVEINLSAIVDKGIAFETNS